MAPRVTLEPPRRADGAAFIAAMRESRELHRPWSQPPTDLAAWRDWIARADADDTDIELVRLRDGGAIAGYFVLSQIFRKGFQNAYLGYDGVAAHTGQGYMSEGMALLLRHAFRTHRLHRVEANVQPANARSKALLGRAGFRREGFSPRYLKIGGRWRDHERWAMTVEDWRAR
jgi:ribosomal-protein-alanine N-acetyltransferase